MSKLLLDIYDLEDMNRYLKLGINAFIINIVEFSSEKMSNIYLEQVKIITELSEDIDIFINLDRLYFDEDINSIKTLLKKLNKMKVKKIMTCDIGMIEIVKELGLKFEIFNGSSTLNTNYQSINYLSNYYRGFLLSNEINAEEINEIADNTNTILILQIYGKQLMFTSKRKLLTSYFQYNNMEVTAFNAQHPLIIKDASQDPNYSYIYEDNNGTYITTLNNINAVDYFESFKEHGINYLYLNNLFIDKNVYYVMVKIYNDFLNEYIGIIDAQARTYLLDGTSHDSFLENKTVFNLDDIKERETLF
ncbi:MAG: U32 family peptidase [Bacilli bacterium]|nr:U32 family peptidase [Bacilli bacterium]